MDIAAVGVSIAIFNQVSKICIYPLVSVTTSFVAEEDAIMSTCVEEVKGEDLEKACPANAETEELPPCNGIDISQFSSSILTLNIRAQTNLFGLCTQLPTLTDSEKIGCTASFVPKFCGGFGGNRRYIPSVSSALIVGGVVGLLQAVFLIFAAKFVLRIMGVNSVSIYS